jgi:DUF1365 family protein
MIDAIEHIVGVTTHARKGQVGHKFRYGVDFVLLDAEAAIIGTGLFSRNRFNLVSVYDVDHGGPLKAGTGVVWVRRALKDAGLDAPHLRLLLLTQPRFMGYSFNPVSFWLVMDQAALVAVIAEVSTPFGDRHSYLCHAPGFAQITPATSIIKPKMLHVSPFQQVAGRYEFSFDIRADQIAIRILFRNGDESLVATLSGPRAPLSNLGMLTAALRRPFGALRTTVLIYWQALRLKLLGASYKARPTPTTNEIT